MGILKEIGDRSATAEALLGFARVLAVQGDLETARRLSQESLAILRELGNKDSIAACLEDLAVVLVAQEVPRVAARLWGTAETIRKAIGAPMLPVDRADYERAVAAARTELGEEAFAKAWAEGGTLPLEEVLDEVLKRAR